MSLKDKKFIDVLNYNDNVVTVAGMNDKGYSFIPGSYDDPCIVPMTIDEINYINSRCNAFKDGVLRFRDEDQEEIYESIGINKDNLLFNEWIEDAVRNPNTVKLNQILAITKSAQFERIRGCYYSLLNSGEDISVKVGRLIDARYRELRNGKLHTSLIITSNDGSATSEVNHDVATLKAQVEEQGRMLEQYKQMMEKMLNSGATISSESNPSAEAPKRARSSKKKSDEIVETSADA